MSDSGVIVICPACGQSFMAMPRVQQVVKTTFGVTYHFTAWGVDHEC